MLQGPIFAGLAFDPFSVFDDGADTAEVGVGGRHVVPGSRGIPGGYNARRSFRSVPRCRRAGSSSPEGCDFLVWCERSILPCICGCSGAPRTSCSRSRRAGMRRVGGGAFENVALAGTFPPDGGRARETGPSCLDPIFFRFPAGADGGTRTRTPERARDFKSRASTNFATSASAHRSPSRRPGSSGELESDVRRQANGSRDGGRSRCASPACGEPWLKRCFARARPLLRKR